MITEFQIFEKNWKPKNVPNWFFLVLRLPTEIFSHINTQRKEVLSSLMNMELIQLKGISDHYNISKSWFDVRDMLLIMKGSDVMKLNDIEPIEYFNADSFCKNNFKFWRRVTQNSPNFSIYKNQDVAFSSAIRQIFQDLHYSNVKINKKGGLDFNVTYDKNGVIKYIEESQYVLSDKVSHLYHLGQLKVNNLNDFTNVMLEILKDYTKDYPRTKSYSYAAEFWKKIEDYINNELTFKELKKILDRSFQYLSKVYEKEGEWYNNSKSLKIPRGSILYFKQKGKRVDAYSSNGLEPEEIQKIVKDYGLDHIYQVKTVDNHMEMMEILKNEYSNENHVIKESNKIKCFNILCFSKMLEKKKFILKNGEFRVRVIIKGDGDELDRTFDIEVPSMKNLRQDFETSKEYKKELDYYKEYETSVIGWNLYGEESEWKEIFYSEIEDVIQDLNDK